MNFNSNLQVRDHENSAFCAGAGWVLSGEWGWTCKGSQRILKQLKVCNCPYKRLRSLWSTCHGPWGTRALKVLKLKLRFKKPFSFYLGALALDVPVSDVSYMELLRFLWHICLRANSFGAI